MVELDIKRGGKLRDIPGMILVWVMAWEVGGSYVCYWGQVRKGLEDGEGLRYQSLR